MGPRKLMAAVLLTTCAAASVLPVQTARGDTEGNGIQTVDVDAEIADSYTITIPKHITISQTSGCAAYTVTVTGDAAGDKEITVIPDGGFLLFQEGKDPVTATVSQSFVRWTYDPASGRILCAGSGEGMPSASASGMVSAEGLSAGCWTGTFSLAVRIRRAAGLYGSDGSLLCSWDTLVDEYGMDIEQDHANYSTTTVLPGSMRAVLYDTDTGELKKEFQNAAELVIPGTVTRIGQSAFDCCYCLTKVDIPDSVTVIGRSAFNSCKALEDITVPSSVTEVGIKAFAHCTSLTKAALPEGLTDISDYMFWGCSSPSSITVPSSVRTIGYRAFYTCRALRSLTLEKTSCWYYGTSRGARTSCLDETSLLDPAGTVKYFVPAPYCNYYWTRLDGPQ